MLPCFICGEDASTGWIKGFVPGPDSQKLALCRAHDTPENRGKITREWLKLMKANYEAVASVEAQRVRAVGPWADGPPGAGRGEPRLMNIRFMVGGYMSLPCLKYEVTPNGTLEVETPEGHLQSFPLQHVKSYEVSPASPKAPKPEQPSADSVADKPGMTEPVEKQEAVSKTELADGF